ncbi:MAG TPA: serine/threonine-protein kinase [Polyangia bacterium]|nr:serine/threonine-protein kinase [Polyangia bacterium]
MPCLDENTTLALAEGRLPEDARADVIAHLVTCRACRRAVILGRPRARARSTPRSAIDASVTMSLDASFEPMVRTPTPGARGGHDDAEDAIELPRGAIIGRYTLLELVGRGGVGEVYAAYDPKLDRRIALKLLRAERMGPVDAGEARLLREAQAIAKISHPNVVTVHDVGTHVDRVFLAMEYVDGATVKDWLAQAPRTQHEVLAVFAAAARGLAAAHDAGLVHRDFKPQNVMVGRDGGVRVMDFGLVRQLGDGGDAGGDGPFDDAADAPAHVELTRTGDLVGTPRYMAPEQFKAEPTDARTDQFSFCVALYEALYGQRPFAGATIAELFANVVAGRVVPPPAKANMPGWLRRIVLRGLETQPERRFPSMHAVVAALEHDPTVRRRRVALGVGVAACAVLAVAGLRRVSSAPVVDCGAGAARWAGVWSPRVDDARRGAIRAAFLATGRSYAERAFANAAASLDKYVATWVGGYEDACRAHVRGEQSAEVLDLRMACLDERRTTAVALADLFTQADGHVVDNAAGATDALPRLERCANVAELKAVVPPPEGEAQRARVEALRGELARFLALRDAGHCADAERLADSLITRVRAAGYAPLLADTLAAAGRLGNDCADNATMLARYEEAYVVSVSARYDETAALAAMSAGLTSADRFNDAKRGRIWIDIAHATLQRGPRHPLLEAWYQAALSAVLEAEGRNAEAVEAARASQAARAKLLGTESLDAVFVGNNVALALEAAGRNAEAVAEFARAEALARRVVGEEHPMIALLRGNEGEAREALRDWAGARAAYDDALTRWRRAGSDDVYVAFGLAGRGRTLLGEGQPLDAIAPLEEALRLWRAGTRGEADVKATLARALWARPADHARARALAERARIENETAGAKDKARAITAWLAAPSATL